MRPSTSTPKASTNAIHYSIGPVSISGRALDALPHFEAWRIETVPIDARPAPRAPSAAKWLNAERYSGIETPSWFAWISNTDRSATIWGETDTLRWKEALPTAIPAILRREGLLDGHGAVIAPNRFRPDDGVLVTGLSGAGKSTLAVSASVGGARFLTDDSVAIGLENGALRAWPRRHTVGISTTTRDLLLPGTVGREAEGKIFFSAKYALGPAYAESLAIRAVVFIERPPEPAAGRKKLLRTETTRLRSAEAYARLLMGHPILALDTGARPCFPVVRHLSSLPAYRMIGGSDLLDPAVACSTLSALLPQDREGDVE